MRFLSFTPDTAEPIHLFESHGASSVPLGDGNGETHVYCLYLEPGGEIGPHPAGFDQLFLVVGGTAWAAGSSGERLVLQSGQGVVFQKGELHSKGSEAGATVLMVQVSELKRA